MHNTVRDDRIPEYELFETTGNPLNLENVAADHPDIVERFRHEVEKWRRMAEAQRLQDDAKASSEISSEELERLRSLRHIQ